MKILVNIKNFLGAGKTTFIQRLVRRTGRDFYIYEMEQARRIDARRLRQDSPTSRFGESTENVAARGQQDLRRRC